MRLALGRGGWQPVELLTVRDIVQALECWGAPSGQQMLCMLLTAVMTHVVRRSHGSAYWGMCCCLHAPGR